MTTIHTKIRVQGDIQQGANRAKIAKTVGRAKRVDKVLTVKGAIGVIEKESSIDIVSAI